MDYQTALKNGLLKSGNVVAFKTNKTLLDKIVSFFSGPYHHCAILYTNPINNEVMIYEANYRYGVRLVGFNIGYLPFDLIETNIDFTPNVESYANAQVGKSYSWINFLLVIFHLNFSIFGFICSTLVGAILTKANDKLTISGLTPTALVNDLLSQGKTLVTVDSP